MNWAKTFTLNIIALTLAAGLGMIATSEVAYHHEIPVGELPIAPWVRATFAAIVVAAIAPRTGFWARFAVFTGVYLLELALAVLTTAAAIEIVVTYFDGDGEAAKPWTYFGAITPVISGVAGYFTLRQFRRPVANSSAEAVRP
jgi:hypothetical protein